VNNFQKKNSKNKKIKKIKKNEELTRGIFLTPLSPY